MFFQRGSSNGASERFSRTNISVRVTQGSCFLPRHPDAHSCPYRCRWFSRSPIAGCFIAGVLFPCCSEFISELFFVRHRFLQIPPNIRIIDRERSEANRESREFVFQLIFKMGLSTAFSTSEQRLSSELSGTPSPDCSFCSCRTPLCRYRAPLPVFHRYFANGIEQLLDIFCRL